MTPRARFKPDSAFRMVAEDHRTPTKIRIAALEQIVRPSIRFLSRLAADPKTPNRLRYAVAVKLETILVLRANQKGPSNGKSGR